MPLAQELKNFISNEAGPTLRQGLNWEQLLGAFTGNAYLGRYGSEIDAHCMIRGSPSAQVQAMADIVTEGLDPERTLHTAPLNPSEEAAAHIGGGGDSWQDGHFILISSPGNYIHEEGVAAVLVNPALTRFLPKLKEHLPDTPFYTYDEAAEFLYDIGRIDRKETDNFKAYGKEYRDWCIRRGIIEQWGVDVNYSLFETIYPLDETSPQQGSSNNWLERASQLASWFKKAFSNAEKSNDVPSTTPSGSNSIVSKVEWYPVLNRHGQECLYATKHSLNTTDIDKLKKELNRHQIGYEEKQSSYNDKNVIAVSGSDRTRLIQKFPKTQKNRSLDSIDKLTT